MDGFVDRSVLRFMMPPQSLLLFQSSSILFILLLLQLQCPCDSKSYCAPSSCGIIPNISSPFRLKGDPMHCGDGRFELVCENNVTSLYLKSHKFYVKAINYTTFSDPTIRLVDASLNNDDTCSFPNSSASAYNFSAVSQYPYFDTMNYSNYTLYDVAWPINFMSCPHPLKNSSLFTDISHCATSNSSSSHHRFSYVKVGHMNASDLTYMCSLDRMVMTSWRFKDLNNISLSEVHHSLLYGFDLVFCSGCVNPLRTNWIESGKWAIFKQVFFYGFLPVSVGLVCALISPPLLTIFGFAAVSLILYYVCGALYTMIYAENYSDYDPSLFILTGTGFVLLAPRIIIFLFVLWLFVYKFRRRHLSVYNGIESFLQDDNKLMPIRYSYSDIKRITRGFQDILGEGGYGSVYKGKLRSGHDVVVKLQKRSTSDGQDFMNEIATIGRIHHINVIRLVGYCAHGSKRALVFDFMPNGSLEKYLFNREKMDSLSLDKKFEIVVGVANGIEYLHRGCDVQILHFDIKPHNILLDDKFIPKISDFGLAKLFPTKKNSITLTAARGTIGYVAPELINRSIGRVSYKVDVYSFGMLLMEMVNLNRNLRGNNDGSSKYFPCWIYECLSHGKDIEIGEVEENGNHYYDEIRRKLFRKMTIVALWCIQMNSDDRPSMNKVLEMLEGDVERLQLPKYPSQLTKTLIIDDQTETTYSTDSVSLLHHCDAVHCVDILAQE